LQKKSMTFMSKERPISVKELLAIVKKRKILERLKEKEWLIYQQKMKNDERKLMDEIASARHVRKT